MNLCTFLDYNSHSIGDDIATSCLFAAFHDIPVYQYFIYRGQEGHDEGEGKGEEERGPERKRERERERVWGSEAGVEKRSALLINAK